MRRLFCLLGIAASAACASPPLERFEYAEAHMGTEFRILLFAADRARADAAAAAALARIASLDEALSDFAPQSELSRLCARSDEGAPTAACALSADLRRVLACAQEVARASGGAFDVTVGPYVRLWRRARRQEELPSPALLETAARSVGFEKLALEPGQSAVRLLAPEMRLDLGGIAKGFALDEALVLLRAHGIERALLVGGGELLAGEPPPGERGWRIELVGLEAAGESGELVRAALSTSGDLERYVELAGKRYSHVVDPRTGEALSERRLVSVLAPSGILADALATAVSVLGPAEGLALAARYPGVETRVLVRSDERTRVFATPGFEGALSCAGSGPRGSEP